MGNFITTMVAVVTPLLSKEVVLPWLYNPYNLGGIPFQQPATWMYATTYLVSNSVIIGLVAILSGLMTTLNQCNKMDLGEAYRQAKLPIVWGIIGTIVVHFASLIKAPLLAVFNWLPYADHLVTGALVAVFVMLGGMWANQNSRDHVCKIHEIPKTK
jgi:hypothetical protein